MSKKVVDLNRPPLFSPSVLRRLGERRGSQKNVTLSSLPVYESSNIGSSSSFRYDQPGTGIRSTQEIDIDYTVFENHTFFNSAVAKVNTVFEKVINEFPFDGTQKEFEVFEDGMTGYEKHMFDNFPNYVGFLNFSGTQVTEASPAALGTHIIVEDLAGNLFPGFSKLKTGERVIDPGDNSLSVEFHLMIPSQSNDNQIICQKISGTSGEYGFSLGIRSSSMTMATASVVFGVSSGSARLVTSASFTKGKFEHICATFDRNPGINKLMIYVNSVLKSTSSKAYEMGTLDFGNSQFIIGSGSKFSVPASSIADEFGGGDQFTPLQTLSGAIDELRIFHNVRERLELQKEGKKNIFAGGELRTYFKFNEPTGTYNLNDVVLDSSGYSLHSKIVNFNEPLRQTGSLKPPIIYEEKRTSPIMFMGHEEVFKLNNRLLEAAEEYDADNPNLITKLIPIHYLLEGRQIEGLTSVTGSLGKPYEVMNIPGSGKIGSPQLIAGFLLVWAKHFDEVKMFIDHFSNLVHVGYDNEISAADKFLPFVANYYGFELPSFYSNAFPLQYLEGTNITQNYTRSLKSLKYVQNQIWRRILANLSEITRSKGTVHSVKALIRAAGINPDSTFRIKEYGGPQRSSLRAITQKRTEVAGMLDFSGSLAAPDPGATINAHGFSSHRPYITGSYLSSSRLEVGWPKLGSNIVFSSFGDDYYKPWTEGGSYNFGLHGISKNKADGMWTSGSWTVEAIYQFKKGRRHLVSQSLMRLHTTGSAVGARKAAGESGIAWANLIAVSGTNDSGSLYLYARPGMDLSISPTEERLRLFPLLKLHLTGVNLFGGDKWNISFGRYRGDDPSRLIETPAHIAGVRKGGFATGSWTLSSTFFIRAARQSYGKIRETYTTSTIFMAARYKDLPHGFLGGTQQVLGQGSIQNNVSGSFIVIGSQSLTRGSTEWGLNDTAVVQEDARYTNFSGQIGFLKFFSKGLKLDEWKEQVRNIKSVGTENPEVTFNFLSEPTGAFERMRVNVPFDQATTRSNDDGSITIFDFSQNNINFYGQGFEKNKNVIKPEDYDYGMLSPGFDEAQTDNKIRIRSFQREENITDDVISYRAPLFNLPKIDMPMDDTKFRVDFSIVNTLNEDIMSIFSTLDFFDNAMGDPNLFWEEEYPRIEQVRKIYFNRLTEKINFKKFFDFFRWFDTSFSILIEQLLPRKTKFLGVNFVIEPHLLERNRVRYFFYNSYLPNSEKTIPDLGGITDVFDAVVLSSAGLPGEETESE